MNGNLQPPAASVAANGQPRPSTTTAPAGSSATPPLGPDGQPLRRRRPRPKVDPMRPAYRPLKQIARPIVSLTQMNEGGKLKTTAPGSDDQDQSRSGDDFRREYQQLGAVRLPLVVTRRDMKELRHHVMRLSGKARVDIENQEQFTRPIRLHRRDPRAPPSGAGTVVEDEDTKEDLEESKERERLEIQKEERRKIREENQAKIAPSATKKPPAFQKKTEQKYRPDDTPEAKKRQLLRYEETLPWHLEDFENRQTWVGAYESELSETHITLAPEFINGRDVMQLTPLERWYKFTVKGNLKERTADDAENSLKERLKMPGFLDKIEQRSMKMEKAAAQGARSRMKTRVGGGADDEGRIRRKFEDDDDTPIIKREADADDIDFNLEDDFADDEEGLNGLFEGDEADVKDATERLRRDQLAASAFELRSEAEIYRQEEQERLQAELQRELEKDLRKSLIKREKNIEYDDRSESNPYASSSSDSETDSETERQRAKEEEERKTAEQNGKAADNDKIASGASTKGSNTPSGGNKSLDVNKKKRPGSPNLSEASGNESSRKKKKKNHDKNLDGSRKSSLAHVNDGSKRGAASGSDSEMTDAGRVKKQKLKVKLTSNASPSGSPWGSRAGSPAATQMNGSRAGSPAAPGANAAPQPKPLPSASEVYKALPAEGMAIQELISAFKGRVDKNNSQLFIKLVKAVSTFDKQRSWLVPLPEMPSEAHIQTILKGQKAAPSKSAAASPS